MKVSKIDDFHIHLRQGKMMETVTQLLRTSGVRSCYVMPNLKPPITTTDMAIEYQSQLSSIAPEIEFFMTLYLCPELTAQEILKASKMGIIGVKSYPRGVTTNSDSGIEDYSKYYHVFKAMEDVGMILNLHGEIPSDPLNNICVLNAEESFLKHLKQLHADFPKLKIVLEHATTKAAVEMVKSLGDTVGCTITLHHLILTVDDWAGQCHNYCKPVAKFPKDREALQQVIKERHPRFFLGTDSAPHPKYMKECSNSAAGVFTGSNTLEYLATVLDSFEALECLESFASKNGRKFYGMSGSESEDRLNLERQSVDVPMEYEFIDELGEKRSIVPFLAGKKLKFKITNF